MLTYLGISGILAAAAIASERFPNRARSLGITCTIILILFAGLRFETGHDWLNYTGRYLDATAFPEAVDEIASSPLELAFFMLTAAAKTLGLSIFAFLFLIAAISILPVHYIASKITRNVALVWTVVFGLTFLFSFMTLVRQSLATSAFFLALAWSIEGRRVRSGAAMALAIGIHVTAAVFLPVLMLTKYRPRTGPVVAFLIVGSIIAIARINLIEVAANLALHLPTQIGLKLALYAATPPSKITSGSFLLIMFHMGILGFLLYRSHSERWANAAIWLSILTIGAHLFFFGLPTIWNRLMIASLPIEIAMAWHIMKGANLSTRVAGIVALSALSSAGLAYFLTKPTAIPFIPYQFLPAVIASGRCGDGVERIVKAQELAPLVDARKVPKEILSADPTSHAEEQPWSKVKNLIHSSYGFCTA